MVAKVQQAEMLELKVWGMKKQKRKEKLILSKEFGELVAIIKTRHENTSARQMETVFQYSGCNQTCHHEHGHSHLESALSHHTPALLNSRT
jgi:hypothetical protein